MFCPKCGKEIADNSKFCDSCGANLSEAAEQQPANPERAAAETSNPGSANQANAETAKKQEAQAPDFADFDDAPPMPEPEVVAPKKKIDFKKFIPLGAAAVGVLALVLVINGVMSSTKKSDNAYVYLSDGSYELITNLKKDESIEIASSKSDDVWSSMVQFSPDGKYVYYYTKYDSDEGTGSLCRAEFGKLKKDSSKNDKYIEVIGSNVCLGFKFLDDGTLLYQNGESALYYYNGTEAVRVAKDVVSAYTDGSNRLAYRSGNYDDGYSLYGVKLDDIENKTKLASNVSSVYSTEDLDNIFFTKEGDDYEESLYVVGFDKEAEKLGNDVYVLDYSDGSITYTSKNKESLSLYDYVTDSHKEADAGITEPDLDDYATPYYEYYRLDSYDEASDYGEIYTSCTQSVSFFSGWWSYYSIEEQLESETDEEYAAALQVFVTKYKSQENEEGYIVVDDAVKADLKALVAVYGYEDENDWLELCFSKEQDGYTYDYDTYESELNKYEEAETRISVREGLQNKENNYPVYSMYQYKDGNAELIADKMLNYRYFDGAIMFNTVDQVTDTMKLEDLYSYYDVYDLFYIDEEAQNYLIQIGSEQPSAAMYQMSEGAAEAFAEVESADYAELYVVGNNVYMNEGNGALSVAPIEENLIGDFSFITDDAVVLDIVDNTIYYCSGMYDSNGKYFCDLYVYKDGESERLAQDILCSNIQLYEDGKILAYTDSSSYGYELTLFGPDSEKTLIAEDISDYIRVDKSTLLYISDEDLYVYNGKEKKMVKTDVEYIWSLNEMEVTNTLTYYSYDDYDYYE